MNTVNNFDNNSKGHDITFTGFFDNDLSQRDFDENLTMTPSNFWFFNPCGQIELPENEYDLVTVETRGYSQGDYAKVRVDFDQLEKLYGKRPSKESVEKELSHYFWDSPVHATIEINDLEFYYTDCGLNFYSWDRERYIKKVVEQAKEHDIIVTYEELDALLPETLEYS